MIRENSVTLFLVDFPNENYTDRKQQGMWR